MAEQVHLTANNTTAQKNRRSNLIIFTLILLVIALIVAFFYFTQWRYHISTEDAYVNGNQVQITSQITGVVQAIGVNDTDMVKSGQLLVALDKTDNSLALETAQAQLKTAIRQFKIQSVSVGQADASITQAQTAFNEINSQIDTAKVALKTAQADYQRRAQLVKMNAVSQEELQHAADKVATAQAQLEVSLAKQNTAKTAIATAKAQRNTTLANIGDSNVLNQPAVQSAITNIQNAWLNLTRTQITAPVDGQVARRSVQLGQKINAGTPLMVIVPLHDLWVDANFKENQLKDIRIGQKVLLKSDLYGDEVEYHGKVVGLSAGTGSAFSALPAQNATGNWIKVTQRVPVRIALDEQEVAKHPLRVGLSMHAEIDSRDAVNQPQVATATANTKPVAVMTVQADMTGAQQIIEQILHDSK
ncbi:HlyD family efflux transporter periplasmic adaptor subunit [Faucicola boevrei]|uniref:HlyD family efflux transporter periplasmic adaptor subunit n=1 Tax=Faucicola boevrei TaxID=346665 RepID=UPI000365DC39|nr:HlyD family efflux transporter periplasmic adaptor subunit [Moraxella boevrei]